MRLYDASGAPIAIVGASNPGGDSPTAQPAWPNIADNDTATKWMDATVLGTDGSVTSTLSLELNGTQAVDRYELLTANDNPRRDPISWVFGLLHSNTSFEVLSEVTEVALALGNAPRLLRRWLTGPQGNRS